MAKTKSMKRELNKNPMIGNMPSETIANVVGALRWLNSLGSFVSEAYGGGEPIESIKFGRYLLGRCCVDALEAAGYEIECAGKLARNGVVQAPVTD